MTLATKIYELDCFQNDLRIMWKKSVQKLLPNIESATDDLFTSVIDWNYLLTCGSILSHSEVADHQDAALRIAQNCLVDSETSCVQKAAATVILNKLTNKQSIELAIERQYVTEDVHDLVPLPLKIEQTRRDAEYTIYTKEKREVFLNKFQKLFYDKTHQVNHVSASAPTSAGKSFILNLFVLEELHDTRKLNVVYIVPTRALISQVERDFNKELEDNGLQNVLVTSVPQLPEGVDAEKSKIFIFTQERLHWLLSERPDFPVDLLIVDEAQKIGDGGRGILLQQKIEELVKRLPNLRVLFCSALTENPEILLSDLGPNASTQSIRTDYITVNQNLIWVSPTQGAPRKWQIDLCAKSEFMHLGTLSFEQALKEKQKLPLFAHHLGSTDGGNMVYVNGQADAEQTAEYLFNLVGEEAEMKDSEIDELVELTSQIVHPQYALCRVLKRGIAFHYGNMPLAIKDGIEKLFSEGKIKYLICTSTLLEGVNLPARTIFLRSPKRGNSEPMSEDDFWNLVGRAGRLRKEFQGNVVCVDPKKWNPPKERKRYYITRAVTEVTKNTIAFLEYIRSGTPRTNINDSFEYLFGYYYTIYLRQGNLNGVAADSEFLTELETEFSKLKETLEISDEIIFKNPGISPIAQQKLLDSFKEYEGDLVNLIPVIPDEGSAENHYLHIIERISDTLSGEAKGGRAFAMAILVVSWIRGYSLGRIINANYKYWKGRDTETKIGKVIRDTMRDIEEYVRFKFAKYSTCYTDVLRFYFETEHKELSKKIPELNMWVEFGVHQITQTSLIKLGFSRHTAIELSEYMTNMNLDREQCIGWIKENDVSDLALPDSMKKEYRDIKSRHQS